MKLVDAEVLESIAAPRDADGPVFREPWEAQAFALAVELRANGLFTWTQWAAALAQEIARAGAAGDPDLGDTYYRHWLGALERLLVRQGTIDLATLAATRDAWDRAARATPHGQPILLQGRDR